MEQELNEANIKAKKAQEQIKMIEKECNNRLADQ